MQSHHARIRLTELRKRCRRLTPVVVDLGPGQPRLSSYMAGVSGRRSSAKLVLSPIAADAIPEGPARVVVRTREPDGSCFEIAAQGIERVGVQSAVVPLQGASAAHLPTRHRPRSVVEAREPMFLLAPSTASDSPVHTFPIVDLSADACAIEAGTPPPVGTLLNQVEIIRDRDVARRGAAVVEEVIPWRPPDGRSRFRCRLRLMDGEAAPAGSSYDLVSSPHDVLRLLRLASLSRSVGVSVELEDDVHLAGCDIEVGRDEMTLVTASSVDLPPRVRLSFELFTIAYELDVRRLDAGSGTRFRLSLPLFLRRKRARQEPRIRVPADRELWIEVLNPLTEKTERKPLLDVSGGGLCFEADAGADVLWAGMRLGPATLFSSVDEGGIELGELEVRSVQRRNGRTTAHCALVRRTDELHGQLSQIVTSLKHPSLDLHRGEGFRGMLDLYRRSGLLYDYMARNLEPVAPAAGFNWRKLHREGRDLVRTLVHESDEGALDATVSAVRVWEQGWVVQHFGASSAANQSRWSGELQRAIVDHVMLHPTGRFLFFFVNASNAPMNAFYERFFEATGTSEAIEHGLVDFWALAPGAAEPRRDASSHVVRAMRGADEEVVARAAERALGTRTAAALSLVPGGIGLPRASGAFRGIGLERSRRARIVTDRGTPRLALLSEALSPGVNLTWMLSAHWLLPIHDRGKPDRAARRAAFETIEAEDAPSPHGERFLFTPAGMWSEELRDRGWELRVTARTYVMNRAGLHRYYHYVADRYGAAEARSERRQHRQLTERAG